MKVLRDSKMSKNNVNEIVLVGGVQEPKIQSLLVIFLEKNL